MRRSAMKDRANRRFGIVSDTHGLLREEVLETLGSVDGIVHAGDVDTPEVLDRLRSLAPVTAVRGNMDARGPLARLPETEALRIGPVWVYVLHDLERLDVSPAAAGFGVVISGHTHRPSRETRDGVLYLNPGSAGPRRFALPVTLAILEVSDDRVNTRFVTLCR